MKENANTAGNAPRVLAGLVPSRIVNYVMKDGQVRPLIVTRVWNELGTINGFLFYDGSNDVDNFPSGTPSSFISSCGYSEEEKRPGSWHWPVRQPVVAAGIDAAAFRTQLEALLPELSAKEREEWLRTVNAKIAAFDKYLKDSLAAFAKGNGPAGKAPAAAAPKKEPQSGICAKPGCGRDYGDNVHHIEGRAKHHAFVPPSKPSRSKKAAKKKK